VSDVNGLGDGRPTPKASGSGSTATAVPIVNTALLASEVWFCVSCAVTRTFACVVGVFGTVHWYEPEFAMPATIGFQLSPLSVEYSRSIPVTPMLSPAVHCTACCVAGANTSAPFGRVSVAVGATASTLGSTFVRFSLPAPQRLFGTAPADVTFASTVALVVRRWRASVGPIVGRCWSIIATAPVTIGVDIDVPCCTACLPSSTAKCGSQPAPAPPATHCVESADAIADPGAEMSGFMTLSRRGPDDENEQIAFSVWPHIHVPPADEVHDARVVCAATQMMESPVPGEPSVMSSLKRVANVSDALAAPGFVRFENDQKSTLPALATLTGMTVRTQLPLAGFGVPPRSETST
jgi:hypothetical protein